jgi:o-succinylbenzoate synthase
VFPVITLHPFTLPLVQPFRSSLGTFDHRQGLIVRVEANGFVGYGEASPLPGLSTETIEDLHADLLPLAATDPPLGLQPSEIDEWVSAHAHTTSGRHGLATALLDRSARQRAIPLCQILHPRPMTEVPISHLYTNDEALLHATMLGVQTVKVKVGIGTVEEEAKHLKSIRSIIGPGVDIRLDANGAWTEAEAKEALTHFAPYRIATIEEPVQHRDIDAMARLRATGVAIAADESVRTMDELNAIIAANAVDIVVIKPMLVGSPITAVHMMHTAAKAGIQIIVTTTIDAAVGRLTALHIAAAGPQGQMRSCGLNTGAWLASDNARTPDMAGSHVNVPTSPGLDVEPRL